ncbi:MAG: Adenylate/guanylate cyclase [Pedosphaera sp.]|nr:Adenylate/guanylate cyclase [Pedosphaera sp.]
MCCSGFFVYFYGVKLKTLKRAPFLIAAGVIGLVCLVQVLRWDFVERLERITYDMRARRAVKHSPLIATNLGFVAVSDDTITRLKNGSLGFHYGLYWPRHIYGRALREMHEQGAKGVAFDILFSELRPDHAPVLMSDDSTVESDDYFALQMKKAGNAILAAEQRTVPPDLFRTNALALGNIQAEKDPDGILRRARAFGIYTNWNRFLRQVERDPAFGVDLAKAEITPEMLILHRTELAPVKIPLDKDGTFDLAVLGGKNLPAKIARRQKAFTEERIWHMGIQLAARELKLDLEHAQVDLPKGRITLHGTNGIVREIPVDEGGYFYINWCLTGGDKRLTMDAFENLLKQDQLRHKGETNELVNNWKDKLVVIGSTATGNDLTDRGATPLQKDTILVSKHWNVANSVITGQFVRHSSLFVEVLLICLMGASAGLLSWIFRGHSVLGGFSILLVLAGYWVIAFMIFINYRYWIPIVLPEVGGVLMTYTTLMIYLVMFEQEEQRRVKGVFNRIVSPDVVSELLKTEKLSLTGARRNVTVMFADIRGFTEMTDVNRDKAAEYIKEHQLMGDAAEAIFDTQARETLATVNAYLKVIAETVLKHNGTIDKFIGDCVMAFWGAPISNPQHALCCVRAAIDAQRAVYQLNQEREAENKQREIENVKRLAAGQPPLQPLPILAVGTGINTGVVTVGLMGSDKLSSYTVFGRDVNLASRLESVSGRSRIIVSEATLAEMIQDDPTLALTCVELAPVNVKGIRTAVHIFEVPWRQDQVPAPPASAHCEPSGKAVDPTQADKAVVS